MEADISIRNCKIVTTEGIMKAGIAIKEDKIVSVSEDDCLPQARQTIDGKGNYVLPGLVDAHMHYLAPSEEDWRINIGNETRASAAGGVTTAIHCLWEQAWPPL